jgi:hypothetical protein
MVSHAVVKRRTAIKELLYVFVKSSHGTRWKLFDGYLAKSATALTATMEVTSPVSITYRLSLESMVSVVDIPVLRQRKV